jgi:hypothetical protein
MSQQGSNGQGGAGPHRQITWVGMQHLMHGYCGRAGGAPEPEQPAGAGAAGAASDTGPAEVRPVALVRTRPRQGRVVRIGPPRRAESTPAA